ncbi:hypothetical protein C8Q77DRAFT_1203825, partial [Trametes polyzona]
MAAARSDCPNDVIAEEMARAMQRETTSGPRPIECDIPAAGQRSDQYYSTRLTRGATMARLPQELLLHIFKSIPPPSHEYDPSIIQGPRSEWMSTLRARKALVMTCKAFVGPAMEVLYEDIVLRRMGQVPALARTLDPLRNPSADSIAALVRKVRMDSCVVWAPFADVVREELHLILRQCTSLKEFAFYPHINFSFEAGPTSDTFDAFNPMWLLEFNSGDGSTNGLLHAPIAHGLSSLDLKLSLHSKPEFVALHELLGSASRLEKLKLDLTSYFPHYPPQFSGPIALHSLRDMSFSCRNDHHWFLDYVCDLWELPSLQALTLVEPGILSIARVLRTHGAHLTYLQWNRHWYSETSDDAFSDLCRVCPRLEHLVVQRSPAGLLPVVRSPTLRFL